MAAAKKQTKKDLEDKIAELEAKLTKLATQMEAKPAENQNQLRNRTKNQNQLITSKTKTS